MGRNRRSWLWPLGVLAGGAVALLWGGCWHRAMSWPIREKDCTYQVCLSCGIKRLFDETSFRGYGRFGYDLHELIAQERAQRVQKQRRSA